MSKRVDNREKMRRGAFKAGLNTMISKKKREETQIKIRRDKKTTRLKKRRNMTDTIAYDITPPKNEIHILLQNLYQKLSTSERLSATIKVRRLLASPSDPPIDEVVQSGIIPILLKNLKIADRQLQFESLWSLTNISAGTTNNCKAIILADTLSCISPFLMSEHEEIRDQSLWCIGNLAGDSTPYRDLILQTNILTVLLPHITASAKLSFVRLATWVMTNLCRGSPAPTFEYVKATVGKYAELIHSEDEETLIDVLWGLSYLSNACNEQIQFVSDSGILPRLMKLLNHQNPAIQSPALRILGNVVSGNDAQTQTVLELGLLPNLFSLLYSSKIAIRKETCWLISNITAGTSDQISMIQQSGLFSPIFIMAKSEPFIIKKEIAWIISNACKGGNVKVIQHLIDIGYLTALSSLLTCEDVDIIKITLDTISDMIRTSPAQCIEMMEESNGVEMIEELQKHLNSDIYENAGNILETYFDGEVEEDTMCILSDM